MTWRRLPEDLQDIVWAFCNDLRVPILRYHKFVRLEMRAFGILQEGYNRPLLPSDIVRHYGYLGAYALKDLVELTYIQAQGKPCAKV